MSRMSVLNPVRAIRTAAATALFAAAVLAVAALAFPRGVSAEASNQAVLALPAPSLSAQAHADGVMLRWKFDASSAPDGWRLSGFYFTVTIDLPGGALGGPLWFSPTLDATARSYKDPLTKTTVAQRMPGAKINFEIRALFRRNSDNAEQVGRSSPKLVFRAPALPGPNNFKIVDHPSIPTLPGQSAQLLTWSHPHPAWDSSTGFDKVSFYIIYKGSKEIYRSTGPITGYPVLASYKCPRGYQIRVVYGLFFSDLHSPAEGRKHC